MPAMIQYLDHRATAALVFKLTDTWMACHDFEPCSAEDPPCRGAILIKSIEAQTSTHWCGVEVRRRGSISGVVLITRSVARSPRIA
ncbi:hypothetical protein TNCV_519121 [Trichonephila clavipes]|nr:hypothetical protein TNCV_519121 [Trichonephila clavipes]